MGLLHGQNFFPLNDMQVVSVGGKEKVRKKHNPEKLNFIINIEEFLFKLLQFYFLSQPNKKIKKISIFDKERK